MIKKVFLQTQFGKPHSWTQEYFDNCNKLEKYGWYWKIFTPNDIKSQGNVEVIKMTLEEFDALILDKCAVNPENYLENELPHKLVSDYYPAYGLIFEDYIKDFDYWGHTNWDIVYGRLDKFIPDSEISKYDIWTDDVNTINGIFTLYKNETYINLLFMSIPEWKEMFVRHQLFGVDEYHMTELVKKEAKEKTIKYGFPPYYFLHSHDRLEQHVPDVKLEMKEDGSLFELFQDINHPNWQHARPIAGKEIAFFHFLRTKKWPLLDNK